MTSTLDLAALLLRAQGLQGLDLAIAPADDMFRYSLDAGMTPDMAGLEYVRSGYEAFSVVENTLAAVGRSLASEERMLEFAAGYGRLTRFFARAIEPSRLDTSDILEPAVNFVRKRFGVGGFLSATDPAELAIEKRYSLIYVGSLFSHLPRERFVPMLRRLYQALTPDGLLLFSTHGTELIGSDAGFVFREESESHVLDKQEYGATFVAPEVVRELSAEAGVQHLWQLPRELWWCQDLNVAAPRDHPGLAELRHASVARGKIVQVDIDPERAHAWVGGFVRVPRRGPALERVELLLDGELCFDAVLAPYETDMGAGEPSAQFLQRDWYLEGSFAGLPPGAHGLLALAHFADGARTLFDVRPL